MNITLLTSSYPRYPGDGAAPFVQSIAESLAEQGHRVEVVAPYDALVGPDPAAIVPVHRFRYALLNRWHIMGHARSLAGDVRFRPGVFFLLPFFILAEFCAALRVARRQHTSLIYAHWVVPNAVIGACVARLLKVPLVISLHGSDVFVARRYYLPGLAARWAFRTAQVITASSEDLRQGALALGAAPERTHVVPYGVDPARFHPNTPPLTRAQLGLPDDARVVLSLGRLVPKKGFDTLVRALPALVAHEPRTYIVIGGEGPARGELERIAASAGLADHLCLPGRIPWDETPAFLAAADVFVLPSVRDQAGNMDGLPNVLLEALSLGKPAVASRLAGVPLVIEDGINGLLTPPADAEALTERILRLLANPAQAAQLGRAARATIEERVNWQVIGMELSRLFEATAPIKTTLLTA
jgi:glycosyltransferase involved in cell wall biosynthesis